ncbi:helix-turn-helix domain-containing protein [Pedobacter cryoconitis]|uniref:Transcriptional regulator with XRE-family HTH domain n=1 Tax=Pedobacter cryoconitis TaxID=188932 RepID=A0A7X0MIW3_9SPHI|nr:helix-turn-helix transcriptional regulator [Pedobacter cryoconitis]MBB6498965.1 transcriptional regulator with XRE-family HTH domain [Pedobacter cryoconitis]
MDWKEEIKLKFAENLIELLAEYGKKNGVNPSLRKLAIRAELEHSHVQRISKGRVDLSLTTIISLAKGLDIEPTKLLECFKNESIS